MEDLERGKRERKEGVGVKACVGKDSRGRKKTETTVTSKSIIKAEKGTKPRKKANKGINRKTTQKPVFPPC